MDSDPGARFGLGLLVTLGFVLAEVGFGISSHSLALLSDAGHNLGDVLGLGLAWLAAVLARRLPTARRTYGLRRTTILAALANSLLLVLAVAAIGVEAIRRLSQPHTVDSRTVVVVALVGVAVNVLAARLVGWGDRDLKVRAAATHQLADAAVSGGVAVAGILMALTGWTWIDPVASLLVGIAILVGAWGLLRESLDLAMDVVPGGIDPAQVESYFRSVPGVREVHDLHIWGLSTSECALTVHLVSDEPADDRRLAEVRAELKRRFGIGHTTIQFDQQHLPGGI
jgi:cobalt-zinc-cadmium efflux system protein